MIKLFFRWIMLDTDADPRLDALLDRHFKRGVRRFTLANPHFRVTFNTSVSLFISESTKSGYFTDKNGRIIFNFYHGKPSFKNFVRIQKIYDQLYN